MLATISGCTMIDVGDLESLSAISVIRNIVVDSWYVDDGRSKTCN
jgi:hypothetical protein